MRPRTELSGRSKSVTENPGEGNLHDLDEQRISDLAHQAANAEFNFNHMNKPSMFVPV